MTPDESRMHKMTWRGVLPLLLDAIAHGGPEVRKLAAAELRTMADAADRWNALYPIKPTEH